MGKNEITIKVPEGMEIDKDNSTFEKIVFKEKAKNEPVTTYEQIKNVRGYIVENEGCGIETLDADEIEFSDQDFINHVWPSKEEAFASIALAQLLFLRDNWRKNHEAEVKSQRTHPAFIINFDTEYDGKLKIKIVNETTYHAPLSFFSCKATEEFAKTFKDLILQAAPLL